ncbi:hypothetical protein PP940_gp105 [Rhizobium phage RL2RES]|uniref:Uncharacterized protein n=1 Tax=Rhizobium phage RL2RES TaxID=103371 RepID=A0A6B9J1W1_9CAUD|nr:hypothetical protein PP940_gp105 [Rhizobium phage RL2RES]QGZ14227.1 hypothetical protein RL2RES_105 [Rhizobium phage RL2RES]
MTETKVLYIKVGDREPRIPVVSREEWARIFSEYPDHLRYHVANLAAHNWDVVMIEGRILVSCAWSGGHWIDKDGTRTDLTDEELDAFYPRFDDHEQKMYYPKFTVVSHTPRIVRQIRIVMPEER